MIVIGVFFCLIAMLDMILIVLLPETYEIFISFQDTGTPVAAPDPFSSSAASALLFVI